VQPDTPAAKAGLKIGDVITQFAGKKVSGPEQLRQLVEESPIGSTQPLTLLRGGKQLTVNVTLLQQPANYGMAPSEMRQPENEGSTSFDKLGLQVSTLTPAVAQKLGIKTAEGVVITDVQPGSAAAQAGLTTGMVITQADHKAVKTPDDLKAALSPAAMAKGVLLLVQTGQGSRFVVVPPVS
jgi:serine protease Do